MQYREKQLVAPTFAEATAAVSELRRLLYTDEGVERWRRPLEIHAYPHLQDLRVDAIEPGHVIDLLRELRARSPKSVPRLGQQIAAVLSWAVAHGFRPDNPCDAALAAFSPPRRSETRPHPALPYADVPAAVAQLRIAPYRLGARLLFEFLILTVVRSDAARGALWSEVDLEAASWTVPATRMPNGAEHRIPLSSAALAVLGEARDDAGLSEARSRGGSADLVFPSVRGQVAVLGEARDDAGLSDARSRGGSADLVFPSVRGQVLSKSALSSMLHQMDIGATLSGFRCSFAEWAADTGVSPTVARRCLSLSDPSSTSLAISRRDLWSHRVPVLERWGRHVAPHRCLGDGFGGDPAAVD